MAIIFDSEKKIFALLTQNTTYMMGIADEKYLGHIHYGKKIGQAEGAYLMRTEEMHFQWSFLVAV